MARNVRNPKIDTRSARAKLSARREPYWTVITEGCALGSRRGTKGGTWIARFRDDSGHQHYAALGAADDARDPDGLTVFSFPQAQARARDWFKLKATEQAGDLAPLDGPYTVTDAVSDYLADYKRDPAAARKFVSQGESARDEKLDVSELAAYSALASLMLNIDETITKE